MSEDQAKKYTMLVIGIIIAITSILYFSLVFINSPSVNTNQTGIDELIGNLGDNEEKIEKDVFYNGSISIDGISTLPNDKVVINDKKTLIKNHKDIFEENSSRTYFDGPNSNETLERFSDRIMINIDNDRNSNKDIYHTNNITYTRELLNDRTSYNAKKSDISLNRIHRSELINATFSDLKITDFIETQEGYKLNMTSNVGFDNLESSLSKRSISDAKATAIINSQGLFTDLDLQVFADSNVILPTQQKYSFSVDTIGGVEINRPNWINSAGNNNAIINGSLDTDKNHIILKHNKLSYIEEGSEISILPQDGESDTLRINDTFEKGDTMYLRPKSLIEWEYSINKVPDKSEIDIENTEYIVSIGREENNRGVIYYSELLDNSNP